MKETFNDTPIDWDPSVSITSMLRKKWAAQPEAVQWEIKSSLGSQWVPVRVGQFVDEVKLLARGLLASGIRKGDSVAILARTSYEFSLLDFSCWWIGALPVAIYGSDSQTQITHIINDTKPGIIITDNEAQAEMMRDLTRDREDVREILVLENGAVTALNHRGEMHPELAEEVEQLSLSVTGEDVATIIYTSGTTGVPRGVVLTHANFSFATISGVTGFKEIVFGPGRRTLLFLPLAHVFARYIEVFPVTSDMVLGHAPDTKNLVADLQSFKPTLLLTAPRVLEKVYNAAAQKAAGGLKQRLFRWSAKAAIGHSRARQSGTGMTPYLEAKRFIADKLVLSKLSKVMGGNLKYIISGGAPLSPRMGHFFTSAGFSVMEGYGLSETTAPICNNPPHASKIGTIGLPFPQVSIRVSDEGEIQVKAPLVFKEYLHDPEGTAAAMTEDGYFRTGDLGDIDEDGYIRITGRAKDVIVTAGGKTVSPGLVEDRLRGHPLVSHAVCVGDNKPFIGALVTLDADMLPSWLESKGFEPLTIEQAARDERVLAALDAAVTRANEPVSRAESIRKFVVLTEDFSVENGMMTPSLKVKRSAVVTRYAAEIAELYGETLGEQD